MNTPITAELLWRVHRTALGGVSAATGDPLPMTLAENKFPAVKMSHWAMTLVHARLTGNVDPPLPDGMTPVEQELVLGRLRDAGLLPEPVPSVEANTIGALVDRVLSPPTMGMGGGSKAEEAAQERHKAECATALRVAYMNHTDAASRAVLRALCPLVGIETGSGSVDLKDAAKGMQELAKAGQAFGLGTDAKQTTAKALFDRIKDLAPKSVGGNLGQPSAYADHEENTELATLAHSFKAVCEGLAASSPVMATLESFAEPVRVETTQPEIRAGVTIWDWGSLSRGAVAALCQARGVSTLAGSSNEALMAEAMRRGLIPMADATGSEPIHVDGAPDASCVPDAGF